LLVETGIDNGYRRSGGLELDCEEDEISVEEWRREGISVEFLNEAEARRLEPALCKGVGGAYHLPDMAQVRNPRHLKALQAGCAKLGVRILPGCPVHGFVRQGQKISAVKTGQGILSAGRYLLAAGAWTDSLLDDLGWRPGIKPIRGQIALLNTGTPLIQRILLQGKCYLVPRGDGRILAGSTEEDAGFDKSTTAGAIADLVSFAARLVPRLADAQLEKSWAGLRPGSPDGMPFLGAVPGFDNIFVAAGHFRAGLQLSPATALVMKELILNQPHSIPLACFRVDRRPSPPVRLAFRS
jgi:glycine oxidase